MLREVYLRFPEWPATQGGIPEDRPIGGGGTVPGRREFPASPVLPRRAAYSAAGICALADWATTAAAVQARPRRMARGRQERNIAR